MSTFEWIAIANYTLVAVAVAELLYSRPKGWVWWVLSVLIIPAFGILSLIQAPKSIAYRRRLNQMKAEAARAPYGGDPFD